jgi:hypothetical protein
MEMILEVAMPRPERIRIIGHDSEIRVLASQWLNGDPKATKRVETPYSALRDFRSRTSRRNR